ncbi:unnamed protein product, partial [Closterium sp. NIES-54]
VFLLASVVFLGFPPDAPGWQFYHPTSRRVLSSQDITFDESVPYYRLFPYRSASLPPPPLFLPPGPPPVDPLPPQGPAPTGVSQVDAAEPVEVAVDSGAATGAEPAGAGSGGAGFGGAETEGAEPAGAGTWGAEPAGAESGGAEPGGAESGGAEPWGAEPGGAASGGTEPGGAEPGGTEPRGAEPGGAGSARVASRGASLRREVLSPQELREWFARRWGRAAGAGGTTAATGSGGTCPGGAGAAGPGGTAEAAGVGPTGGSAGASGGPGAAGSARPGAARATGVGAAGGVGAGGSAAAGTSEGAGAGAARAGGATGAGAPARSRGAVPAGSGGAPRPRPYFVPLLEQPVSPLPAPSPYTGPTGGLAERRAPASRPACTSRRTSRPRPPAVPGTHQMALRPSTAPLRVPLPSPPASSLPAFRDPESDSLRAASPTVARFLATVVTDPSLVSTAASTLVAELVDFAARCRLDYATHLVAESESVCPPSVGGECALSTDVLEDRQEEFQCFAAALPHLVSTLIAPEGDPDAPDIPTPRSYAEAIEEKPEAEKPEAEKPDAEKLNSAKPTTAPAKTQTKAVINCMTSVSTVYDRDAEERIHNRFNNELNTLIPPEVYANLAHTIAGPNTWYLDSCCGQQMCSSETRFIMNQRRLENPVVVTVANNQRLRAHWMGSIVLDSVEEDFSLHLNEVLLVPRLGFNLMSSAQLMKNGITLLDEPGKFTLKYGEKKLVTEVEQNGVFVLNFIPERTTAESDNILSLGPWEHRNDIDYTDDTVPREGVVPTSSITAAVVMLTFDDQGLNDVQNSREYMATVEGWGDPTNMPTNDGIWGAD